MLTLHELLESQMLYTNFVDIGPLVLQNNTLKGLFTIYACGGHIGHVTNIIFINFHFPAPKRVDTKFGKI